MTTNPQVMALAMSSFNCAPSSSRLPPDLFDTYLSYKQSTKSVVQWLSNHGGFNETPSPYSPFSIRDLLEISTNVRRKSIRMPPPMAYVFRQMIDARAKLGKFFKKSGDNGEVAVDNESHEFFTICLREIYDRVCGLLETKQNLSDNSKRLSGAQQSEKQHNVTNFSNRFEALEGVLAKVENNVDVSTHSWTCQITHVKPFQPSQVNSSLLAHDDLGADIEFLQNTEEIRRLRATVKVSWQQARAGDIPPFVAVFITNAALEVVKQLEEKPDSCIGTLDPQTLLDRHKKLQGSIESAAETSTPSSSCLSFDESTSLEEIRGPWNALLEYKSTLTESSDQLGCTCPRFQKPEEYLPGRASDRSKSEEVCLNVILDNMRRLVKSSPGRITNAVERRGTPLYHEVAAFVANANASRSIFCAFGLRILLDSNQIYLPGRRSNSRVETLRYAEDVILNIKAVLADATMPCRCCRTLAFYLQLLQEDLLRYTHERIFDVYFQSPWVAGSHLLEIMEAAFYYGLRLSSYRNFVGAVLHTYNVLTCCNGMKEIPVLERLCGVFTKSIFLGERPSRNFHSSLLRFMGGRLRFRKFSQHPRSKSHTSYGLELPQSMGHETGGQGLGLRKELNDDRFGYDKISMFYHLKGQTYPLGEALGEALHGKSKKAKRKSDTGDGKPPIGQHDDLHGNLQELKQIVLQDVEGDFPVAKVNFFSVYLACVRIVQVISNKSHEERDRACICFADRLLRATDEYQANRNGKEAFPRELVDICKEAMRSVFEGKELTDFLWTI